MYVAADGLLRLALIDQAESAPRFREILARVHTHERAGRAIQLARIDVRGRALSVARRVLFLRIERCVAAQIALDRDEASVAATLVLELQLRRRLWRRDAQPHGPTPQARGQSS